MRNFNVLIPDTQLKDAAIVNKFEKGNLDIFLLSDAVTLDNNTVEQIMNDLKIFLKVKKINPDLIRNSYSLKILSKKAIDLMLPFIKDDAQIIDLDLINEATHEIITGYSLVHPIRSFRCLDFDKTEFVDKDEPVVLGNDITIQSQKIPDSIHIFRLTENPEYVLISQELLEAISGKGLTGMCVIVCDSV